MQSNTFKIIVKTLYGLEEILAQEMEQLGCQDIQIGRRMVSFVGDKSMLYKANFKLRTALRVLMPIATFKANNPDELYQKMKQINWHTYLSVDKTFAIDTVVYSDQFTHSKYAAYKAKDAIADYFKEQDNKRPSVRLENPDFLFNIHISQSDVTISLDSSGDSLHKRGYREVQTSAPINEVLAAGILLMAGWKGETDFLDPMCGSGTFLIEAALIARNIAPGIYRKGYAFQRWADYDEELFQSIYHDDSEEKDFNYKIYGSDISSIAVEIARRNVLRAGLSSSITIEKISFKARPQPSRLCLLVTNPPYGERLKLSDAEALYSMIGEKLKHTYTGCKAWIIAYKSEHFNFIGLRQHERIPLMNGSLPCELRAYDLFKGKIEEFKRSERSVNASKEKTEKRTDSIRKDSTKSRSFKKEKKKRDYSDNKPKNNALSKKEISTNKLDKQKNDRQNNKNGLWPSDRFRARENRQHFSRRLQVYRADEEMNKNE